MKNVAETSLRLRIIKLVEFNRLFFYLLLGDCGVLLGALIHSLGFLNIILTDYRFLSSYIALNCCLHDDFTLLLNII